MTESDQRADELSDLADRIDRFDRAHSQVKLSEPLRDRPTQPLISPAEQKARRLFLVIASAWGVVVFVLIIVEGWGRLRPWELVLAGPLVALCVWGMYGFHIFYAELGKSALRMLRRKTTGD